MLRGGIVLTFSGTNLDVVAQPVFVYTDPRINSTLGVRRYTCIHMLHLVLLTHAQPLKIEHLV